MKGPFGRGRWVKPLVEDDYPLSPDLHLAESLTWRLGGIADFRRTIATRCRQRSAGSNPVVGITADVLVSSAFGRVFERGTVPESRLT